MFSLSPPQPSLFFAANRPLLSSAYTPQTPSPLRTSRNANLMSTPRNRENDNGSSSPPQLNSSPLGRKFGDGAEGKENGFGFNALETPVDKMKDAQQGEACLITPPWSGSSHHAQQYPGSGQRQHSTTTQFSINLQASSSSNKTPSEWESRARSASPAATLARHAANGREKKKSQFLDRIRRRRDDGRADNIGDQVLRMDFVNERRVWEDEMRRRALLEEGPISDIDADVEMDGEMTGTEPAQMSPTEEHNFGVDEAELANCFEEIQRKNESQEFLVDDDINGDEYDALFLEILSQEQNTGPGVPSQQGPGHEKEQGRFESSMDLS